MTAGQLRTPREYSLQLRQHHAARFAPTAQDVLKVGPVYSRLLGKPAKTELAKKAEEGNDQVVPEIQEILAANPDLAWRLMNIGKTAERLLIDRMTQVGREAIKDNERKGLQLRTTFLGAYRGHAALRRVRIRDGDKLLHDPQNRLLPMRQKISPGSTRLLAEYVFSGGRD